MGVDVIDQYAYKTKGIMRTFSRNKKVEDTIRGAETGGERNIH